MEMTKIQLVTVQMLTCLINTKGVKFRAKTNHPYATQNVLEDAIQLLAKFKETNTPEEALTAFIKGKSFKKWYVEDLLDLAVVMSAMIKPDRTETGALAHVWTITDLLVQLNGMV